MLATAGVVDGLEAVERVECYLLCAGGMSQTKTYIVGGRKREECVGELGNGAGHKQGLTLWRGGRGRSGLVSLETWHVKNEDSQTGGEEEEDQVSELGNVAHHK